MSLVGPRPLPRSLLEGLDTSTRQRVRPGWAGPAQLWLLKHGSLSKQRQVDLDNDYVTNRSLWANSRILVATGLSVLRPKKLDLAPDANPDRVRYGRRLKGR